MNGVAADTTIIFWAIQKFIKNKSLLKIMRLPLGKLNPALLERLLNKYTPREDPRLIVGPKIGEDAAVIDMNDKYLIAKTDPITFATEDIGWYAVNVNANDIATRGATPKWFQATILLPEKKTTEELVEKIFSQIYSACSELDITVIGGHTEVSYGLDRPIVVGSLLGEVSKEKLVITSGAKPGDLIILTKGIVLEGTAIIANEKEKDLIEKGYTKEFIDKAKKFLHDPGISIVRDALLANRYKVNAMHDPTEGGLAAGIYELARASDTGVILFEDQIPIYHESKQLCAEYGLDPLRTITSGALILAADNTNCDKILNLYKENNINATIIGKIQPKEAGMKCIKGDVSKELEFSEKDEITKLFE